MTDSSPASSPAPPTLEELAVVVARLVVEVDRLTRHEAAQAIRAWLTITDPVVAREVFESLLDWIRDVWLRYPDGSLPRCWYRHPWAIEELHACRIAHAGALRKGAAPSLLADWHRTTRPGLVARLDAIATCDHDQHLTPPEPSVLDAPSDVALLVDRWITDRAAL